MKSSRASDLIAALLVLLAAVGIGTWRPHLADDFRAVKAKSDVYVLPSADHTYVASLGYRSAVADLIFAHVLVAYGLHFQERRLFEHVGEYLDVVNRLDPKFRDPYRFADTLLTLQPKVPPPEFYRKARRIQERGLKELPNDQELWYTAGQFITYLAPGQLTDEAEQREFQQAGTRYLMRACDLLGSNQNIPFHCVTAANLLNEQGNRVALRQFLERVLTSSDDPAIQTLAMGYLTRVLGEQAQQEVTARQDRFQRKWRGDLPGSPRVEIGALGPGFAPAPCAGAAHALTLPCATSWAAWATLTDPANGT